MGLDVSAVLVAGVSLDEFFKRTWEKETTYEEHNPRGEKTGKLIREKILMAEMPNGEHVVIGEFVSRYNGRLVLDFYDAMGFEGPDHLDTDLKLNYSDYETNDLSEIIIGKEVVSSDSHRNGDKMVVRISDSDELDEIANEVNNKLNERYGYWGNVNYYLINQVSY